MGEFECLVITNPVKIYPKFYLDSFDALIRPHWIIPESYIIKFINKIAIIEWE